MIMNCWPLKFLAHHQKPTERGIIVRQTGIHCGFGLIDDAAVGLIKAPAGQRPIMQIEV